MKHNFLKLSIERQEKTYGGWSWGTIALAIPLIIEATFSLISSVKLLDSDSGKIKYNDLNVEWKNHKKEIPQSKTAKKINTEQKIFYYAY